jgi:hypothetical protein
MKQRWLPGFCGSELEEPTASASADVSATEADASPRIVLRGQFGLFTAERELLGLLESALLDGRFEDARGLRDALSARQGHSRDTSALAFLDQIGWPRMTVSHARDSAAAGEVRKRMRLLDAALHGQFMRQGVARE